MPYAVAAAAVAAGGAIYSSEQAKGAQNDATGKALNATNAQFQQGRADLSPYRNAGAAALSRLQNLLFSSGASTATNGFISRDKFDGTAYLKANPDVAENPVFAQDPYSHYSQYGMKEGRQGYQGGASQVADSPLLRNFSTDDLANDPVYNSGLKFGMDEGTKAIERRAAAGGGYDSGAALKGITRFANDYGSTKAAESRSRFVEDQNNTFGKLSGIAGMGQGSTSVGVSAGANNASNLSSLYSGQGNANAAASIAGGNAIGSGANSAANYYQQQQLLNQLSGGGQRTKSGSTYDMEQ